MTTINKFILLSLFAALLFGSCQQVETDPIVAPTSAPTLTDPQGGGSYIIEETTFEDLMARFVWTDADFGFDAGIDYTLEVDVAGSSFADPVTLVTQNTLSFEVFNNKMNAIMVMKELPFDSPTMMEVRVVASVSPDVIPLLSNVVSFEVQPYDNSNTVPKLYVTGSFQGFDPATAPLIYSPNDDNAYEGYVNIPEAGVTIKFSEDLANTSVFGGADGTLEQDGAEITIAEAGYYRVRANLIDLTYSFEKTDWGLIGTATAGGWDSDQDMAYDVDRGVWTITTDLTSGEYKFRANDTWTINFGDNDADGSLEQDGANIMLDADGNYTIELMVEGPFYTFSVTPN